MTSRLTLSVTELILGVLLYNLPKVYSNKVGSWYVGSVVPTCQRMVIQQHLRY